MKARLLGLVWGGLRSDLSGKRPGTAAARPTAPPRPCALAGSLTLQGNTHAATSLRFLGFVWLSWPTRDNTACVLSWVGLRFLFALYCDVLYRYKEGILSCFFSFLSPMVPSGPETLLVVETWLVQSTVWFIAHAVHFAPPASPQKLSSQ